MADIKGICNHCEIKTLWDYSDSLGIVCIECGKVPTSPPRNRKYETHVIEFPIRAVNAGTSKD